MSELATQIRDYFEAIDPSFVVEELLPPEASVSQDDVASLPSAPTDRPVYDWIPGRRMRPGWIYALAALAATLIVGGVLLLVRGPRGAEVIETPTTTSLATAPTTVPGSMLDGRITAPMYEDVPAFTGTVRYYEHDPAVGDAGWTATVAISFSGPMRFEAEVLDERGDRLAFGGTGTLLFGDGSESWVMEPGDAAPWSTTDFEPFRHLFFDGERWSPVWDELCGLNPTELGIETIAGRTTIHVLCATALEDYELWIDESTGIVMKAAGPFDAADLSPIVARDGYFEFTAISFEPVATPGPPQQSSPATAYPPFHLVLESADQWGSETIEVWYRDSMTVRRTVIDASDPAGIGTYELMADGYTGGCLVGGAEEGCYWAPLDESLDEDALSRFGFVPLVVVEDYCTEVGPDVVAGRPARHFECDRYFVYDGAGWHAGEGGQVPSEHWYDVETGLPVQHSNDFDSSWATLLETDPVFPDGIFEYEEIIVSEEPNPAQVVGNLAPLFSGEYLDGTPFRLEDLRGKPAVVFDWCPTCGPINMEGLADFQDLYLRYGAEVHFLVVSEERLSETRRLIERNEITVPTVSCILDEVDPLTGSNLACRPDTLWSLWPSGVPSWYLLDSEGRFHVIIPGNQYDLGELERQIVEVASR